MARSNATTTAVVVLILALSSLAFFLGRITAPRAPPLKLPGPSEAERQERSRLETDLATLHKQRSAIEQEIAERRSAWAEERARREAASATREGASGPRPDETASADTDPETTPELDDERAEELVAALEEALEDGDSKRVGELASELLQLGPQVAPDLVALLEGADTLFEMENLARLLGTLKADEALPALQSLLEREENDGVRVAVIEALGKIPDPSSVPLLVAEFTRESDSPLAPSFAASSLGNIGTPDAVSALEKEIDGGSNRMVRAFALRALSEMKEPNLVPFFLAQVQRSEGVSERYRKSAIDAIGETGDEDAIRSLESVLESPDLSQGLREATKRAINKLAGEILYDL